MLMYSTGSECAAGVFVPLGLRSGKPQKHDFRCPNLVMTIELFTIGCSFYRAFVACGMKHFRASSGQKNRCGYNIVSMMSGFADEAGKALAQVGSTVARRVVARSVTARIVNLFRMNIRRHGYMACYALCL
jgi:hypothetical protein